MESQYWWAFGIVVILLAIVDVKCLARHIDSLLSSESKNKADEKDIRAAIERFTYYLDNNTLSPRRRRQYEAKLKKFTSMLNKSIN